MSNHNTKSCKTCKWSDWKHSIVYYCNHMDRLFLLAGSGERSLQGNCGWDAKLWEPRSGHEGFRTNPY